MKYYDREADLFERTRYGHEGGKAYFEINAEIIVSMVDTVEKKLILDLGTGTGRYSKFLAGLGGVPIGVDLSSDMLKVTKQRGMECVRADVEHLPFRSGIFDIVICIKAVGFLPHIKKTFIEANRVLKNEHFFVLNFFNAESIKSRIAKKLGLFIENKLKNVIYWTSLSNTLLSCGFRITRSVGTLWLVSFFWDTNNNRYVSFLAKRIEKFVDKMFPPSWAALTFVCSQKKKSSGLPERNTVCYKS